MGSSAAGREVTLAVTQVAGLAAVDTGTSIPNDGVIVTCIMAGIEPVPIPGIIVMPGTVVPGIVPAIIIRGTIPISPGVIIPGIVVPRPV